MRVLVVSANRVTQPMPVLPLGACLVAQAAERAGHEVHFLDLMFKRNCGAELATELRSLAPDVVGLSIRNIDTNDVTKPLGLADEAAALANLVRSHSRAKLVIGGAAVGVMPEAILKHTNADLAVVADGETVFPEVLDCLAKGSDPFELPGVLAPSSMSLRVPARPTLGQNGFVEDFSRWVDLRAYMHRMVAAPLQTKRGCPFQCVYCTYAMAEGRDYRLHPPERIVSAVASLCNRGVRDIEFVDNVFNSPYEHALEVCRALAAARSPARLQSLELNPRFVDDQLLEEMEQAGFVGIGITAESAADSVLGAMRKGYNSRQVQQAAQVVARHNIPCMWIFMLGGVGETPMTVAQTLDFATTRIRPGDAAFFQIGTRIYPGTQLEQIARRDGVLHVAAQEMLQPTFYVSPGTPLEWLQEQLVRASREHLNFIVGDSLSLPVLQHVQRLSYWLGVRPPLWRHTRKLRRVLSWLGLYRPGVQ